VVGEVLSVVGAVELARAAAGEGADGGGVV